MSARAGVRLAALAILVGACAAETNPAVARRQSEEAARTAIEAAGAQFGNAFRNADLAALTALSTDDIVLTTQDGDVRGAAAVEAFWRDVFANFSVQRLDVHSDVLLIDGGLAVDAGEYSETILPAGGAPVEVNGSYTIVWQQQPDGAWKVRRFTAVDRAPAE